jgi:hypothetical protein
MDEFDVAVKMAIYTTLAETAIMPAAADVAPMIGATEADVAAAFGRLRAVRLLVPEPDDPTRIRMAPPFSGIATPFRVAVRSLTYNANCAWDAYGIAAALHADADIAAADAHTGEPIRLLVRDGRPLHAEAIAPPVVAHFAVPAAHWWDNIIYT